MMGLKDDLKLPTKVLPSILKALTSAATAGLCVLFWEFLPMQRSLGHHTFPLLLHNSSVTVQSELSECLHAHWCILVMIRRIWVMCCYCKHLILALRNIDMLYILVITRILFVGTKHSWEGEKFRHSCTQMIRNMGTVRITDRYE